MKSIYIIFLINLIFVYTLYELTEEDKERLPSPKDRRKFEKYLKKLQLIENMMEPTRVLDEGDTSESGDSESESKPESGKSESGEPAGNQTAPVTAPSIPLEPDRGAKVTLISFYKFNAATTKQKSRKNPDSNKDVYWIDFLIRLFFSAEVEIPSKKVTMTLAVFIHFCDSDILFVT